MIFTAVSYDLFILMYNYNVCIYVNMFACRGPQGRIAVQLNALTSYCYTRVKRGDLPVL